MQPAFAGDLNCVASTCELRTVNFERELKFRRNDLPGGPAWPPLQKLNLSFGYQVSPMLVVVTVCRPGR